MKTKMIPWWENWVRYFIFIFCLFVILSFIVLSFFTIINVNLSHKDILLMVYIIIILVSLLGTIVFFDKSFNLRKIPFKYEIKHGFIPFINGKAIAFPKKENIDIIDWKEPYEFEAIIYPDKSNGQVYAWAGDEPGGWGNEFMVRQSIFINHSEKMRCYGGLKGVWTWKWNRIDFVELVLVKPEITRIRQTNLDFGG
jgi:hypothetical protein